MTLTSWGNLGLWLLTKARRGEGKTEQRGWGCFGKRRRTGAAGNMVLRGASVELCAPCRPDPPDPEREGSQGNGRGACRWEAPGHPPRVVCTGVGGEARSEGRRAAGPPNPTEEAKRSLVSRHWSPLGHPSSLTLTPTELQTIQPGQLLDFQTGAPSKGQGSSPSVQSPQNCPVAIRPQALGPAL